jgi:hypothetical protein
MLGQGVSGAIVVAFLTWWVVKRFSSSERRNREFEDTK